MKLKFNLGYLYLLVCWHKGSCLITQEISTTISKYLKEIDEFYWVNAYNSTRYSTKKL